MPWTVPPMPDDLKAQLMRRQNPMVPVTGAPPDQVGITGVQPRSSDLLYRGAIPSSTPTPIPNANLQSAPQIKPLSSLPYGPQPTPQTVAANQAVEGGGQPAAQPQAQPAAKPAPPPTDDPAIAPVGQPPDVSSYLNPALSRMSDLMAKRAAVPAIDPQKTKPKLWERLAGIALGATQLKNPENAGAVADQVVHRGLYGAERQRNLALQPIDQQIAAEKESFPLYTAAGEAAYRQAELGQGANRENRERFSAKRLADSRDTQNDVREQRETERESNDNERNKTAQDRLREKEDTDQQLRNMQDRIATLREQGLKDKEDKPNTPKPGTPGQFAGLEVKKQQALGKAHSEYQKAVGALAPTDLEGHNQALQDLNDAKQQAQDAYEQEITSLGGTAQHFDYGSQKKGGAKEQPAPDAAVPKAPTTVGKYKIGDEVPLKGGKRVKITAIHPDGKTFDYEPVQ